VTTVLDASALLAVLHGEKGGDVVEELLDGAVMSAVNWSEVLQKAASRGVATDGLGEDMAALGMLIIDFDREAAEATARLWPLVRAAGLSMADRACLALAGAIGVAAVTADTTWADIDIGVPVRVIR
jgi:PIN domain nuclease of toxin-antitoxin system